MSSRTFLHTEKRKRKGFVHRQMMFVSKSMVRSGEKMERLLMAI